MDEIDRLPYEIIVQILREFVNQLDKDCDHFESAATEPYLRKSSYTELIKLRLVSKMWSAAVIPFYFETISINSSKYANVIMDNWKDFIFEPNLYCPVKRLTIGKLSFPKEEGHEKEEVQDEEEEDCKKWREDAEERANLVTVNQLARLIELLGTNLKTLNMTFTCSMGFSPQLIEACKSIKQLKSVAIQLNYEKLDTGPFDIDSISKFLSALPQLECLLFDFSLLEPLRLEPPALQNLRRFSFTFDEIGLEGASHIIHTARETLKVIELFPGSQPTEDIETMFEPVQDTLEGLFTKSFTEQIFGDVNEWDFPSLRLLRTHYPPEEVESEIYWLQDPMLRSVRTIVTNLDCSEEYWIVALEVAGVDALKKAPNLKHIVFTKSEQSEPQEINPELVEALKSFGVQCHLSHELTPDECMELDYTLNGPMK